MDDANTPPTQPSGSLVPPPKIPGMAVALASSPPPPRRPDHGWVEQRTAFERWVERTFDAVDELADAIADGLGLR